MGQAFSAVPIFFGLDIRLADLHIPQGSDPNLTNGGTELAQSSVVWTAYRSSGPPLTQAGKCLLSSIKQIEEDDSERSTCQHSF